MNQKTIEGIQNLNKIIGNKKFLLVKGSSFKNLGIQQYFENCEYIEFSEFTPNPLYEDVCKGVEKFNKYKCVLIVAVGGGSAIDVAKCIKLFSTMDDSMNYLVQEKKENNIPLIVVPTTAGTGSESTKHAVIYYKSEKQSISHESLIPSCIVFEPSVLKLLPLYQKKCTLLDALCQAIESWWSVNSTEESKIYSKKSIIMIKENWEDYINCGSNESLKKLMYASNFAGQAINITATTAAHAMSYKITSEYGLPHGHAVACCMLEVWKYIRMNSEKCIDARGKKYFIDTMREIENVFSYNEFVDLFCKLDMKKPSHKIDKANEVKKLTSSVNLTRLSNNPIKLDFEQIQIMYERIVL